MTTTILALPDLDVKRTSLRVDLEHIDEAMEHLRTARQLLRGVDDTDELRFALAVAIVEAQNVRAVHDAELTTLEVGDAR